MSISNLVDRIAADNDLSRVQAKRIVESVFSGALDAAAKGDEVSVSGFGKFKVKDTAEREGRNPATGETITIAAARKLVFVPAKAAREKLNG